MTLQELTCELHEHVLTQIDSPQGKWRETGFVLDVSVGNYRYRFHPRALWALTCDDKSVTEDQVDSVPVDALKEVITKNMVIVNAGVNAVDDDDFFMNQEYS